MRETPEIAIVCDRSTSCSGRGYGRGRSRTPLITLNTAVGATMPSVRVSAAATANAGARLRRRMARRSWTRTELMTIRPPNAREMDLLRNVTVGQDTRQRGLSDGSHDHVRVILVRVVRPRGQSRDSDPGL